MRKFNIPQIKDERSEEEQVTQKQASHKYKPEPFVSSVFGTKVKDEITYNGAEFGNKGRQYDVFRDKDKRVEKDEYRDYITVRSTIDDNSNQNSHRLSSRNNPDVPRQPTQSPIQRQNQYQAQDEVVYHESVIIEDDNNDRRIVREFDKLEKNNSYEDLEFEIEEEVVHEPLEDHYKVDAAPVRNEPARIKKAQPKQVSKSKKKKYIAPSLSLLKRGKPVSKSDMSSVQYQLERIDESLREFGIGGRVVKFTKGPAVTQFEVQVDAGVRVTKVKNISSDLMANLKARSIRIQAPIPGKSTVGIEVPNNETDLVLFGELLANESFLNDGNPMNVVLGLDLSGEPVYLNIAKMPHALIAGTTGSGKSVCINSIINSILYKAHPDDVRLILIDPKIIEFSSYEDIPHLATPVITEVKLAAAALRWAVEEMENRYQLFRSQRVREYEEYAKVAANKPNVSPIPYIVIIIDELADLMMMAGNDIEDYIQRLTQKGRASGIHLIIATQRPSVDVIKGTIKTNIPTRIAFMVKTQVDSSIILDHSGAEKLLGNGDMLYNDSVSEQRLQGTYISQDEIIRVTDFISENEDADYMFTREDLEEKISSDRQGEGIDDEYFEDIARFVVENQSASINRIQKTFNVGFNRAQSIMQSLEDLGIVSENLGSKARNVEVDLNQLEELLERL